MSLAQLRNEIGKALLGAVLAFIMTVALVVLTGAWSLKENKADHNEDYIKLDSKVDRAMDVLCDAYKQVPRACTNQYPIYPRP